MPLLRLKEATAGYGRGASELVALDRELYRAARGEGRLRLRIGEALEKLFPKHERLGMRWKDWAQERFGRKVGWVDESRRLWRRLQDRPVVRDALERGLIDWSMALMLARHGCVDDDAELVALARRSTTAQLVSELRRRKGERDKPERELDEDGFTTIERRLTLREDAALDNARMIVEHVGGVRDDGEWLEWVLAEAESKLAEVVQPGEGMLDPEIGELLDALKERRQRMVDDKARARARAKLPVNEVEAGQAPEREQLPDGVRELEAHVRALVAELDARDLMLGALAGELFKRCGWEELGYVDAGQYCTERLGMSLSSVYQRIRIDKQTAWLDEVQEALLTSELRWEAAALVCQVATPDEQVLWIERARRRTLRHLKEEVSYAQTKARRTGSRTMVPPSEEEMEQSRPRGRTC